MSRTRVVLLSAFGLCVVCAAPVAAQEIDVPWDGANTFTCAAGSEMLCGQSFTAPSPGALLGSFSFELRTTNDLTFELYALSGNVLTGSPLMIGSYTNPWPDFVRLIFESPLALPLTGGASYAMLARLDPGEEVVFHSNLSGVYPGGTVLAGCQPDCVLLPDEVDLAFRASFVPEPTSLGLLAVGLAALGVKARRSRRPLGARGARAGGAPQETSR